MRDDAVSAEETHEHRCETCGARRECPALACRAQLGRHCWDCIVDGREITPFMLDVCSAFELCAGVVYGAETVELFPSDGYLLFCGVPFAPLGWDDLARSAPTAKHDADDEEREIISNLHRDLASLREDVERRLATRAATGSLWEPRR